MLGKYGSGGGCVSMAFGTNVGSFGYPGGTLYTAGTFGPWCGAIVPGTAFCGMPVFEITTPPMGSCFARGATLGEGASGMMSWNLHCGIGQDTCSGNCESKTTVKSDIEKCIEKIWTQSNISPLGRAEPRGDTHNHQHTTTVNPCIVKKTTHEANRHEKSQRQKNTQMN